MLKKFSFLTLSLLIFIFIIGCSEEQETNKGEFTADKSDFEDNLFTNRQTKRRIINRKRNHYFRKLQ